MNCLEFRRQVLADPLGRDNELLEHEANCPDCRPFARDVRAQEVRLRGILQDVAPPQGMVEQIQLAARFEQRAAVQRRWWYSAAASVLLAIGISMLSLFNTSLERGDVVLARSVLNHIEDESSHLRAARPVTPERLASVFDRFGAQLAGDIGTVNFAAECLMRNRNGVHLVLPGRMGPITVFFMPGEMADGMLAVNSARFDGQIVPTSWGSIAVVGEAGEVLDGLGERLAAAVRWPKPAQAESTALGRGLVAAVRIAQQQNG